MTQEPRKPSRSTRASLRNARGEEIVVETPGPDDPAAPSETVLATNRKGNSLTLLEEFSVRRKRRELRSVLLSLACAAASVAFAVLTYLKTH